MRRSGIPTQTHQKGLAACHLETAVHRDFQIKTFSTELKNHVMVMDFVKSNWFPSQRRAQVCVIHMCRGLKTEEQTGGRYKIHSRHFPSPKDHPAWERSESLSNTGFRDNQCSTNGHIALKNLQSGVSEKKSPFTEAPPASQNTKMISSIVISQLMDENQSRGTGSAGPSDVAQPCSCHAKALVAVPCSVDIHSGLALLPASVRVQTPSHEPGSWTEPPPLEKGSRRGPHQGFASITVTARRVGPPASALPWAGAGDALCSQYVAGGSLLADPWVLDGGVELTGPRRPLVRTELYRNGVVARPWLCEGHVCGVAGGHSSRSGRPPGKDPLLFSSCVHLRVSQPCPNSIYYLDKSLSVPVDPPPTASPKVHRSALSLHLSCSSLRPTPEGVCGLAKGEPMGSGLRVATEHGQNLLGPCWHPGLQENTLKGAPALVRARLGNKRCPWSSSPALGNAGLADVGTDHHEVDYHASGHASQLTIHIPGWSYSAVETKVFSGRSEKQQEPRMTLSAPPVEQKPVKEFLPDGGSSPKRAHQSSTPCGPTESQHHSFPGPRAPLAGFLCPLEDACAPRQDHSGTQIQKELPKAMRADEEEDEENELVEWLPPEHQEARPGWTRDPQSYNLRWDPGCDLVVKIMTCQKKKDVTTPQPLPAPPDTAPSQQHSPQEPDNADLSEADSDVQQIPLSNLTLQEALEAHKPLFISRSQERLKRLELKVQQRKAQRGEPSGPKQNLPPVRTNKKHFTVPHPLSDNLFKPKERCISEKEMYTRSKRIYNNLPEVKKKKEEQKKKVALQSNRLRVQVFKKQLLDQLLQRNAV
ncbi:PREDICTED: centrosomal protein C10orf90 homolog [Chrysochloris asiatica]|uniref:Centrosomal protein C10orf90 homolog n=1 Tax=Chrysochloris asiatica TaxID=185453 RepID=A0A9B0TV59_CHRAS|nr:PREDICTED: centrosomal protein C10orf90 homolog [Chrysochloris asiatica]